MGGPARSPAAILIALVVMPALLAVAPPAAAAVQGYSEYYTCSLTIVAVSSQGTGVTSNLTVTVAYPGRGRVFISTSPASMIDTQGSARLAAFAASMLAGVDMTRYDFFYDIQSPSVIIGGPSAGLAMSLATLLALKGVKCPSNVAVTGMIQPDGSIGPVGGLKEKLEAAAAAGKTVFLIPAGQLVYTYYKTVYKRMGPIVYTVREPVTVNLADLGEQLGVQVVPVASLAQAYEIVTGTALVPPNASTPALPGAVESRLADYTRAAAESARRTAQQLLGSENRVARLLAEQALQYASNATNASEPLASIYALQARLYAAAALYAQWAYANGTDVTGIVDRVNQTLTTTYTSLSSQQATTRTSAELLAKAWAKLGVATYYYTQALQSLDREGDRLLLPRAFLQVDYTPVLLLARAEAFAEWAMLWANTSKAYNNGTAPLPAERLARIAGLLLDEARTMIAYTQVLLEESGAAAPSDADIAAWLVEQAIGANSSLQRIGYSIEAISAATAIIHESFTIDVNQTRDWIARTALAILRSGDIQDPQTALLLRLAYTPGVDEKLSLQAASKAVLYAWLARELPPTGTGETITVTPPKRTGAVEPVSTVERPLEPAEESKTLTIVLAAAAAIALAIAILYIVISSSKQNINQ